MLSVIAAARVDGETWVGSDSLVSSSTLKSKSDPKIFEIAGAIVGLAGSARAYGVLAKTVNAISGSIVCRNDIESFVEFFRKRMEDAGATSEANKDQDFPIHNVELIIGTNFGVFHVDTSYSVVPTDPYWATGTGGELAIGSLYTSFSGTTPYPICYSRGRVFVTKAISAAIEYSPWCGGTPDVREVVPPA